MAMNNAHGVHHSNDFRGQRAEWIAGMKGVCAFTFVGDHEMRPSPHPGFYRAGVATAFVIAALAAAGVCAAAGLPEQTPDHPGASAAARHVDAPHVR